MNTHPQSFLTYAVTLYFDDKTTEEIRMLTKALYEVTGNDYMVRNNVPPHLTLGMFHVNDGDFEKLKALFEGFVAAARERFFADNSCELPFCGFESFLNSAAR